MGRQKTQKEDGSKIFWYKSTYPKPNNFKKFVKDNTIMCSYDIPVYTDRMIGTHIDILNINIPYKIDKEHNVIDLWEDNYLHSIIEDFIGVGLEECNTQFFKRDGIFFPFIHDISIYDRQKNKYFETKLLRERRYKLLRLKNRMK